MKKAPKLSKLLMVTDIIMIVLLTIYAILRIYEFVAAVLYIPLVLTILFILCLLLDKKDTVKARIYSAITVLPFILLGITASIKK